MELRQLAYFVAVAEESHFTRAAQRLRIAQPAVSQQIRRLEAELGEQVFLRDRRSVRLTPAGEALLPHARAALAQVELGRESIAAQRGLYSGPLAIGLVHPLPGREIVRTIGAFARVYPEVRTSVHEGETDALLAGIDDGSLHCAFIGLGPGTEPPADLSSGVVAREPAVLAVHPQHRLAARDEVEFAALRDQPFVSLTHESRLRQVLEASCAQAGFAPRIVAETTDLAVMVLLVAEGVGVALLPRSGLDGAEGVVALDVLGPRVDRRIVVVWRADYVPPAARAFIEHLPISAA
ncbi:LysR family transcriptional regulator [Solirubrobacter soli]|uniref:LysR family transcriptional regulator n=1 Tax=Solirubrobacter soli TaxID=363832 RepID=UPI0003F713C2|nr:LysR family transcriptional regulator [Solirubrobacter soli]